MEAAVNKRETILQATLALIQEHGLNELTTAKIARASGTAETVIYRHFPGKQAIVTELLQRVGADFQSSAEEIVSAPVSPLEKLERLTDFYLNFMQKTHGMQRILFSEQVHLAQSNDSFKQSARNLVFKFRQCVKDIIEEGVKSGQYKADLDIEIAVMSFLGLFFFVKSVNARLMSDVNPLSFTICNCNCCLRWALTLFKWVTFISTGCLAF